MDAAVAPKPRTQEAVTRPLLRGIHHLALNTDDLRGTLDFYVRVLGMPLVHGLITGPGAAQRAASRGNPPFDCIPHYFVDMGGDSLLAFFEFPKGKVAKADRNTLAAMQHVSFVCGPKRFVEMQERLKENGVPIVSGPMVVIPPAVTSMYFYDPNGIRLEITADMGGTEEDLQVTRSCLMDRETMRAELARVSDDARWIESMLDNLREMDR
jgi:catechol 2,3-dioxygenase-like lactoylglutathione lyase family enzyme